MAASHGQVWRRIAGLAALLLGVSLACTDDDGRRLAWIDRIAVNEADIGANPWLGVGSSDLQKRALAALTKNGSIGTVSTDAKAPDGKQAWRARVEIVFVRTVPALPDPAAEEARAEVAVELGMARGPGERLQGDGRSQRTYTPGDPESRGAAFAAALDAALQAAAEEIQLHLEASTRPDEQLVADLSSPDGQRRDFAIRVLSERRSPAAVPYLVERLQDPDRTLQLRAVGALVTIGDPKAAPALIESTLQRDPSFVVQVVYALGEIGGVDAEAYLFTASTGHTEPTVRRAATEALETLRARQAQHASRKAER